MMKLLLTLVGALVACAPAASTRDGLDGTAARAGWTPDRPRLVVLITIDQFRADYIPRWAHQLTGGIGRLVNGGAYFPIAVHDHAITATAPGHAVIGSGRHPRSTGITSNEEGVGDARVTLVEGVGPGASPRDFIGTTFADWLANSDRRTRVLSVSYKDRAAILPIGRRRADVYWYSGIGIFTTSTYYRNALPEWVRTFNGRGLAHEYADRTWALLLPESEYPEPDSVPVENFGQGFVFPHTADDTPQHAPTLLESTPWIDEITLQFASAGVRALELGRGDRTDILALGLSGTDKVGHRYGPDSREVHDQVLRLDRLLGAFLDSLFASVEEENVVVMLTGDHGVGPVQGVSFSADTFPGVRVSLLQTLTETRARLSAAGVHPGAAGVVFGALQVHQGALAAARVPADSVRKWFTEAASRTAGISYVASPSALATRDTVTDDIARRWLHTFPTDNDAPLVVVPVWGGYWGSSNSVANHATPYNYDTDVPLVLYGSPFVRGRVEARVRTVDIAPTLARAVGVVPSERLDGRVLTEALR